MMDRMPKSVKVGPHTYSITRKTAAELPEDLGECETNELRISIRQRLRKTKAQSILLHEVLHACLDPLCRDEKEEELYVETLTVNLLQVLKDNPELIAYLTR